MSDSLRQFRYARTYHVSVQLSMWPITEFHLRMLAAREARPGAQRNFTDANVLVCATHNILKLLAGSCWATVHSNICHAPTGAPETSRARKTTAALHRLSDPW